MSAKLSRSLARVRGALAAFALAVPMLAQAEVSFATDLQAPSVVGQTFVLTMHDGGIDAAVGVTDWTLLLGFDPSLLDLVGAAYGSAFGTADFQQLDVDVTGDSLADPGWAMFFVTRTAGAPSFGNDVITLQFQVLGAPPAGSFDVGFYPYLPGPLDQLSPGYYLFGPADQSGVLASLSAVPEPASAALLIGGLALLGARRATRRRR